MKFQFCHEIKGELDALVDKFTAGIDPKNDAIGDIHGVLNSLRSAQSQITKVLDALANQSSEETTDSQQSEDSENSQE